MMMTTTTQTTFLGIDHIGIAVSKLEDAIRTYRDVLGFTVVQSTQLQERGLHVCMLDIGDAHLELLAPCRDDSEISSFLKKRGEGVHHICVRVDDLDTALQRVARGGGRVVGDVSGVGVDGRRVAFVHPKSTHGVLLEFVEGPAQHDTRGSGDPA